MIDIDIETRDEEHVMDIFGPDIVVIVYRCVDFYWCIYAGQGIFEQRGFKTYDKILDSIADVHEDYKFVLLTAFIDKKYDDPLLLEALERFKIKYGQ